ncbi:MAG: hypothetical protein P4K94_00905, partial [Terracidiphilus sp.]|nr:hypothetical protein [Terracidiphilus sp.]
FRLHLVLICPHTAPEMAVFGITKLDYVSQISFATRDLSVRNPNAIALITGMGAIVPIPVICYYEFTHGLCFSKPLLLLPVEHLRRVYLLVSDLPAQSIQKTHP